MQPELPGRSRLVLTRGGQGRPGGGRQLRPWSSHSLGHRLWGCPHRHSRGERETETLQPTKPGSFLWAPYIKRWPTPVQARLPSPTAVPGVCGAVEQPLNHRAGCTSLFL